MTAELLICKGLKCPLRHYCLRYMVLENPFYDSLEDLMFDCKNMWCKYLITYKEGGEILSEEEVQG